MLKIGLVGVGGISGAHIPAWEAMEDAELVALCDIREEQWKPFPDKRHYVNLDDMLEHETLDILDICVPTYLHTEFALKAMKKGIHVLLEKPISLREEDVDLLYGTARENHVNFMVAQVLRFWPEYEFLKKLYDTGKYGRLISGYMSRISSTPKWSYENWMRDEKKSGLVPFDVHIHDLDFLVYAFGVPTESKSNRIKLQEQDCINAVYEFPDFFVETEAAWYAGALPFRAGYRFQFEKAVVLWEGGKCMIYEDSGRVLDVSQGADTDAGDTGIPKSNAYENEIQYFADCVQKKVFPDKIKPEELKAVIHILKKL